MDFSQELKFLSARSGGKGGQNVNKVETAVIAKWSIKDSELFDDEQKQMICAKLKNRINNDGELVIKSTESRSQLANKKTATIKMLHLVNSNIVQPHKRIATKVPKVVKEKRLFWKKEKSEKKSRRRKDWEI